MSNILVVDDEMGVRESLHVFLTSEGHTIDTACNGREALNLIENKIYDLVLTDMTMPEMDGMTLLKEIKDKFKERTSVIILTADGSVQKAVSAVKEGALDFIVKPFEINRLREAVDNALQRERKMLMAELQRRDLETVHLKQLNQKLDRTVFELSILHEIGKTINSTLEINKIVSIILEMARQTVNANRATLVLYHPETREIKLQLCYSPHDAGGLEELNLTDRRAIQWVTLNKQPLFLEDVQKSALFQQYLGNTEKLGSLMTVPFKRKNQVLGAIVLSTPGGQNRFAAEDLFFITTLANQASIAIENAQLYTELQDYFADTIRALVAAVEAKDTYTFGHSSRVTQYSLMMAQHLDIDPVEKRRLEYLALLHDIGKIGIDEKILRKNSKLNPEEWEVIRNHSTIGGSIIKPIKFLPEGEKIIRHHHERYNGSGYPDGLRGEEIPLFSRVIAVADSFDAMTSLRPYRGTMKADEAILELRRCSGEQFDPKLVDVFINAFIEDERS
jgi:putative nucleotidyltransferase with HDIG domain